MSMQREVNGFELREFPRHFIKIKNPLDRLVDRVKPWFMVYGLVHGLVHGSWIMVHGPVHGFIHGP